jgi:exosortase
MLAGIGYAVVTSVRPFSGSQDELALRMPALVVLWIGAFLLAFGPRALRAAGFAVAFLVFTIPFPTVILDGLTQLLKRGSTEVVATLFALTGTPVHRDGFQFALSTVSIEIADECSGIRSTIALALTALLASHRWLKSGWKQALLVLAILPVTIFKNSVRITTLSLLANYVNPNYLAGRLHHDGGVLFFLIALALLLPLLAILRRSEGAAHVQSAPSR